MDGILADLLFLFYVYGPPKRKEPAEKRFGETSTLNEGMLPALLTFYIFTLQIVMVFPGFPFGFCLFWHCRVFFSHFLHYTGVAWVSVVVITIFSIIPFFGKVHVKLSLNIVQSPHCHLDTFYAVFILLFIHFICDCRICIFI